DQEHADVLRRPKSSLSIHIRSSIDLPRARDRPELAWWHVDVVARIQRRGVPHHAFLPVIGSEPEEDSDETVPGLRRRVEVMGGDHEEGVVRRIPRVREQRGEPERSLPCREQPLAALELTARAGELDALTKKVDGTEAVAAGVVGDVLRVLAQRERGGVAS